MSYEFLQSTLEEINGAKVARVTFNKPPVNALSAAFLEEIENCLNNLDKESVEIVSFWGNQKAFIAGADIGEMSTMNAEQAAAFSHLGHRVMNLIESASFLSIAVLQGYALGGGLEVALACNIRLAAEDSVLGLPEVSLGLIPGFGGTYRLAREVGFSNALYLAGMAEKITGARAYELGLVQASVKADELQELEAKQVKALLKNGPKAVKACKKSMLDSAKALAEHSLATENKIFAQLFDQAEAKEGMSAFLEKRPAQFRNGN